MSINLFDLNAEIVAREEAIFMAAMEDAVVIRDLGIVGVSPYDPTLQKFLGEALDNTTTAEELRAYVAANWDAK